jgi:hypothetical protein
MKLSPHTQVHRYLLLITSSCVLEELSQSFPLPIRKAMKWLTIEAIVVNATTAANSPTSAVLALARLDYLE